jgi:hypothetical protein
MHFQPIVSLIVGVADAEFSEERRFIEPGEAKNYHEAQEVKAPAEGKCYYQTLELKTANEEVGESNCPSANWFDTNQFMY